MTTTLSELIGKIKSLRPGQTGLVCIGISGYGGSGKSTLAARLAQALPGSVVVSIDDFIRRAPTDRSTNWGTFNRARLCHDILSEARPGQSITYLQQQSGIVADHKKGTRRTITLRNYLIIEGCSVLHPRLMHYYDYSIWIDCPQPVALERAEARDQSEGRSYKLWDDVWGPDDRDYFKHFRPDRLADVEIKPAAFEPSGHAQQ